MPESPAAPEIVTVSATFMQDPDTAQENDLQQELHIEVVDSGAGHYVVIRTDRWAMDTPEDLVKLIRRVMAVMEAPADA